MAAWNDAPAAGGLGECAALVRSAEALRFSAPELAVQLARRALVVGAESAGSADVGEARSLSMRAQAMLSSGLVRMSHYVDAVEPALAALALAEGEGVADLAAAIRLDLAACTREVGEPLLGCAVLLPVLEATQLSPSVRAVALGRLIGCVAHVGRRDDIEDALTEADRLLAADDGLSPDARRLERARLSVRAAAYNRWYGDTEDAADAAREGLTQLNRVRGRRPETARLRAQLVLELVCALLDEGALEEAAAVSEAVLAEPVRATSANAVGRLMLAVSTRVHLPSGRVDRGRGLLDQAVWVAERHGLDGLLADVLTAVSQLDEAAERTAEALESLRGARAAEQRRLRAMSQAARHLLMETSPAKWDPKAVNSLLRAVLHAAGHQPATKDWHLAAQRVTQPPRQAAQAATSGDPAWPVDQPAAVGLEQDAASASVAPTTEAPADVAEHAMTAGEQAGATPVATEATELETTVAQPAVAGARADEEQAETDAATGLLNKNGLIRRLRSVRNGERPVALTLVRLDNYGASRFADPGTRAGAADHELTELAGRVRNIAPENAELARSDGSELAVLLPHTTRDQAENLAAAIESAWLGTTNGHSISTGVVQSNPDNPTVDARALINAARHALTPAVGGPGHPLPQPSPADEMADVADLDPGDTLRIGRAIISSLSIPDGSGGKRRAAEEPADPPADEPGYSSSTYEQTKAELGRLMSALNAKKDPPAQGFEATPLPAPSRPAEDHPRNGTALPSQSIPTPPDPPEVPEPEPHPDIPDPAEPDPVPPAPPGPGPEPQPDSGPLNPPTNQDDTSAEPETRSARRRRGGLAAAFGARPEGDSHSTRPRMSLAAAFATDPPDDDSTTPTNHAPDELPTRGAGHPAGWPTERTAGHPTNETSPDRQPGHAAPWETGYTAEAPTDHLADHAPSKQTHRPFADSADQAASGTTGRATDRTTSYPPPESAGHARESAFGSSADHAASETGDAPGWTFGPAADHVAGATTSRTFGGSTDHVAGGTTDRAGDEAFGRGADDAVGGLASRVFGDGADRAVGGTTDRAGGKAFGGSTDHAAGGTTERTFGRSADHAAAEQAGRAADENFGPGADDAVGGLASRVFGGSADHAAGGTTDRTGEKQSGGGSDRAGENGYARERTFDGGADRATGGTTDRAAFGGGSDRAGESGYGREPTFGRGADHAAGEPAGSGGSVGPRADDAVGGLASRVFDGGADHAVGGTTSSAEAKAFGHRADHAVGGVADQSAGNTVGHATNYETYGRSGQEPSRAADRIDLADERPSRQTGEPSSGRLADHRSDQSADRSAGQPAATRPARTQLDGPTGFGPTGEQRVSRAERSSGSTTIAGLLAEALAAYQETSDEPDPEPRQPVRDNDNEFDRLFDWRYQSPASGRHRSPE